MPFQLPDGRTLALDTPFTWADVQYPANWLRLSTPEEKAALGILELAEPPAPPDQRFYWGWDENGNAIPKDHTQLVEQWSAQTRTTAGTLLAPTDWMVIREADNGSPVPDAWRTWREAVRQAAGEKVTAVSATESTSELADYITGSDYPAWPLDPNSSAPSQPSDVDGV